MYYAEINNDKFIPNQSFKRILENVKTTKGLQHIHSVRFYMWSNLSDYMIFKLKYNIIQSITFYDDKSPDYNHLNFHFIYWTTNFFWENNNYYD